MSKTENSNYPAFASDRGGGLTKREYFAGLAMQALITNPNWMAKHKGESYLMQSKIMAEVAIKSADELLTQLDNK